MNKVERILTPWYAINDTPKVYNPYAGRASGADGKAHKKAHAYGESSIIDEEDYSLL